MSRNVTTAPMTSPLRTIGWLQYSAGNDDAVRAPEHLVVDVRLLPMAHRLVDRRLFRRIRRAVRPRVMNQRVHLLADECRRRVVAEQPRTGGIAEDADAAEIDAVDRFGG